MTIETAREVAARIWCDEEYEKVAMMAELAEKIAQLLLKEAEKQVARQPSGETPA